MTATPQVHVVESAKKLTPEQFRKLLVGPGVNQPDPYPGYTGFVGWVTPCLLESGRLIVSFSSGYWHASMPTPYRIKSETVKEYLDMGMPEVECPRGGRAEIIFSDDGGETWTRPTEMMDTALDERHPSCIEVDDEVLLCAYFEASGAEHDYHTRIIRSVDGGSTWTHTESLPSGLVADAADGSFCRLDDGSLLLVVYGWAEEHEKYCLSVVRTDSTGATWEHISTIMSDIEQCEPGIAQLPDGRLVMISRPEGAIQWSSDRGVTWTEPVPMGMRMYECGLHVTPDGTLVCMAGFYNSGDANGVRVILSRDGGETWIAPATNTGFEVDHVAYGYSRGIVLSDGSIYVTYQTTGGHGTEDAANMRINAIRFRVNGDDLELLPGVIPEGVRPYRPDRVG